MLSSLQRQQNENKLININTDRRIYNNNNNRRRKSNLLYDGKLNFNQLVIMTFKILNVITIHFNNAIINIYSSLPAMHQPLFSRWSSKSLLHWNQSLHGLYKHMKLTFIYTLIKKHTTSCSSDGRSVTVSVAITKLKETMLTHLNRGPIAATLHDIILCCLLAFTGRHLCSNDTRISTWSWLEYFAISICSDKNWNMATQNRGLKRSIEKIRGSSKQTF